MLKLEDINPVPGKFTLKSTGKEYILRPFNVSDEAWLKRTFKGEFKELFNEKNVDFEALCRIAFHQLEDKSEFVKKEVIDYDDDGNEIKTTVGGYKLLMSKVAGMQEKVNILYAITETIGISRSQLEKMEKNASPQKKTKKTKK